MLKHFKIIILFAVIVFVFGLVNLGQAQNTSSPYSEDQLILKRVLKELDPEICKELKEMSVDECVFIIANTANDNKYCQQIIDNQKKNDCLEFFVKNKAIDDSDINTCQSLTNESLKEECLIEIFRMKDDLRFCRDLAGEQKIVCEDTINLNLAFANKDIEICNNISNEIQKDDCQNTIKNLPLDSDNDGIFDMDERAYGTDPFNADSDGDELDDLAELSQYMTDANNPDSDGDGFMDGEEVRAGTNPLSPDEVPEKITDKFMTDMEQIKQILVIILIVGAVIAVIIIAILVFKRKKSVSGGDFDV